MREIIITYLSQLQRLFDLWHLAVDSGDAIAQFNLAKCCLKGKQKSSLQKAFALFKNLAHRSYTPIQTEAQFMLGKCYENGYGISKSYPRAIRWYETAAQNISNDLMNNPDPIGEAAYKVFQEIMKDNDGDISKAMDDIFYREITPELIDCVRETAEAGDVDAQVYLMDLYYMGGEGVAADDEEYVYWTRKAAKNGNTKAMNQMGHMYYYGQGVKQDDKMALHWTLKAAEQGSEASIHRLGEYYKGQRRYKEAVKWYREYAELEIKWRNERLGWGKTRHTQ